VKKVILFDMDGTLTEPRQQMGIEIEQHLRLLQQQGYEIGILTGSDMNYVKQQCSGLFDLSLTDTSKIHFLPCNGTKYILNRKTIYERNMRDYMGETLWRRLMIILTSMQHQIVMANDIPLTGHFFDYRGSMLNWCPIGRNADLEDREKWISKNKNEKIRAPMLKELTETLLRAINHYGDLSIADVEIVAKYGGDTSIDLFPVGWDKTYVIDNSDIFKDYEEIYFVGDRCQPNGNDYEIYNHPKTIAFETTSPEVTIQIIEKILNK